LYFIPGTLQHSTKYCIPGILQHPTKKFSTRYTITPNTSQNIFYKTYYTTPNTSQNIVYQTYYTTPYKKIFYKTYCNTLQNIVYQAYYSTQHLTKYFVQGILCNTSQNIVYQTYYNTSHLTKIIFHIACSAVQYYTIISLVIFLVCCLERMYSYCSVALDHHFACNIFGMQ